ncbi:hypothetical protein [Maribacter algarum]|uniref:hypothetical protein n=1 Tax=Maribacter algarum (ex Zhang et al. 2020) TaxID=2578118 RepID=UPI001486B30E|nr:hypothetical protein [Maribacter algarum]
MKNKNSIAKSFHAAIKTQHVYIENEQVFLKKNNQETFMEETNVAEWFPTDFKWIPV